MNPQISAALIAGIFLLLSNVFQHCASKPELPDAKLLEGRFGLSFSDGTDVRLEVHAKEHETASVFQVSGCSSVQLPKSVGSYYNPVNDSYKIVARFNADTRGDNVERSGPNVTAEVRIRTLLGNRGTLTFPTLNTLLPSGVPVQAKPPATISTGPLIMTTVDPDHYVMLFWTPSSIPRRIGFASIRGLLAFGLFYVLFKLLTLTRTTPPAQHTVAADTK